VKQGRTARRGPLNLARLNGGAQKRTGRRDGTGEAGGVDGAAHGGQVDGGQAGDAGGGGACTKMNVAEG